MLGSIGPGELALIFVVALLVFGPRKLPELGRSIGKGLAEFRRASHELRSTLEQEVRAEETRPRASSPSLPEPAAASVPRVTAGPAPEPSEIPRKGGPAPDAEPAVDPPSPSSETSATGS